MSSEPPRSPREEEDLLDLSENRTRRRRHIIGLDLTVFLVLLLLTAVLVIIVTLAIRAWRH